VDDGANFGQEEVAHAGEGKVVEETSIRAVEEGRDGVNDAVDRELFELGLEKVGGREGAGGEDRGACEGAEEVARRVSADAVCSCLCGWRVRRDGEGIEGIAGHEAETDDTVAGVINGVGVGGVDAVGVYAEHVVGSGFWVWEELAIDIVYDTHAVLEE